MTGDTNNNMVTTVYDCQGYEAFSDLNSANSSCGKKGQVPMKKQEDSNLISDWKWIVSKSYEVTDNSFSSKNDALAAIESVQFESMKNIDEERVKSPITGLVKGGDNPSDEEKKSICVIC